MRSYSYFDVSNFPEAGDFETEQQIEQIHTEETTRFRRVGRLELGFEEYDVEHFTRVRFRGIPYSHKEVIDEVTEKHRFEAFLKPDSGYLLMRYAKGVCNEVAHRLTNVGGRTRARRPELDLRRFVENAATGVTGGYFRNLSIPHVRSSSLFGQNVNESEFYDTFEKLGNLSAIIIVLDHGGEPYRMMLTDDYGIGFYQELTPALELEIIQRLKPELDAVRVEGRDEKSTVDDELGPDEAVEEEIQEKLFDE